MSANRNTILVVEDDRVIRALTLMALQQRGYRTLEAADGESGFLAFMRYHNEVDLVLTDVSMPILSGPAMIEKILKLEPAAKIMFMTGTPQGIEGAFLAGKFFPVLPKPFTAEVLASSVQHCLENRK